MLPVALTCPVWWVARWTARMLTSLAVALAFSLGATALPVEATAPSWAALAGDTVLAAADDWSDPALPTRWLRPTPTVDSGLAVTPTARSGHATPTAGSGHAAATAGSGHAATWTADSGRAVIPTADSHLAAVGDVPGPVAVPGAAAPVVPTTGQHVTGGRAPSALGSRAPPAR